MVYKGYAKERQRLEEITGIISSDSKDDFISFVNDPVRSSYISDCLVLEEICVYNSVNCATALLETVPGTDLNYIVDSHGRCPMHIAARNLYSDLVDLFLRHGARTDIPLCEYFEKDFSGLLPLDIALKTSRRLENLKSWTPGDSIFELITILCLPQLKRALDTVRFLARSSEKVEYVAYHFANEGKHIEFALLLMVAREKVLGPITFQSRDGSGLVRTVTLSQRINHLIMPLIDEEFKLMGNAKSRKLAEAHNHEIVVMRSLLLLLELFQRAGDVIEEYLQLQQPDVLRDQVAKDVASRLLEAGFDLERADSDIRNRDWDLTKHAMEESEESYPHPCLHPLFSWRENTHFFPDKRMLGIGFPWSLPSRHGILGVSSIGRSIHTNQVSKCNVGSLYSKELVVQVKKRTKAIEQYAPKFMTSEKWAYFGLVIKRGMRHA